MKNLGLSKLCRWGCVALLTVLAGCSTLDVSSNAPMLAKADQLAVLPIANYTETPDAGQRAQSIAQSILHQKGLVVQQYPNDDAADSLIGGADHNQAQALDWARKSGAQYALGGSVQEWRYKVGVDGEPVAGLTFNLIDLKSGAVVWSATGSRSGWSRSSVAGVGQTLIRQLLSPLTSR
ncbi:penicillin-binding protein activator LpoB [Eoetvoesiella caeni]|uniref:Peptidoglycan-synthase activator LpoB n=1 Tax=Eoetvoesiella caeni TaxID=645616 RepID=A0A366H148_9BURK|nr:penicillin-binding protein activator LpoB [Eoetvoesiella caeni]MCI2810887.1 penicillin-binding protein activator LpoB [Eoetvoesiella caeni]NYT56814.1 penicillin-binding protein activator LpoB [Eoetvoesiella caeni]RBP35612.1 peptidoglycan-synthase activator LpoB [Eoetvoesiella caeni]